MLPYYAAPPPAARGRRRAARDDERQRLRRADRVRATATRWSGWPASPTCSSSTTGRSRRARTTRSCAARSLVCAARAGSCPASIELPAPPSARCSPAAPSSRARSASRKGGRAWVGHHIGDLKNWETLRSYRDGVAHFERLFAVAPELVAHDLHPDYLSTGYALEREGVELVGVQHHHAHLAACLAEHGEPGPAVGAIFDGAGLGPDGTVWGGELLVGGARGLRARRPPLAGAAAGRRRGRARAVADGVRVAARARGRRPPVPPALAAHVDARALGRGRARSSAAARRRR